jgi:hypothetical protein
MAATVARGAFARYRPVVTVASLEELDGPTDGVVHLPHHLDWGPNPDYALADPGRLAMLYAVVLSEASTVGDLVRFINDGMLQEIWTTLNLPERVRRRWEERFPSLAQ